MNQLSKKLIRFSVLIVIFEAQSVMEVQFQRQQSLLNSQYPESWTWISENPIVVNVSTQNFAKSYVNYLNCPTYITKSHAKYLFIMQEWGWVVVVVSQFNGTSTLKGSYSAKTGDKDCNVNSSRYTQLHCVRAFAIKPSLNKNVRQDLIPHPMRNFPYDSCGGDRDLPLNSLSSCNIKCRARKLSAQ